MESYIEFLSNTLKMGSVTFLLTMFPMRNMLSSISALQIFFVAGFERLDYDISLFI